MDEQVEEVAVEESTKWQNVALLDLPVDHPVWATLDEVGLSREYIAELQKKHMTKNGTPKALHLLAIGDDTFVIRQLRQGDYQKVNELYLQKEAKALELIHATNPGAALSQQEMDTIEQHCVCLVGVVWPENFDPTDEDNHFLSVPSLHYKIMEISGAFEVPVTKKV